MRVVLRVSVSGRMHVQLIAGVSIGLLLLSGRIHAAREVTACELIDSASTVIALPMLVVCGEATGDIEISNATHIHRISFAIDVPENYGFEVLPEPSSDYVFSATYGAGLIFVTVEAVGVRFGVEVVRLHAVARCQCLCADPPNCLFYECGLPFEAVPVLPMGALDSVGTSIPVGTRWGGIFSSVDYVLRVLIGGVYHSDGTTPLPGAKAWLLSIDGARLDGSAIAGKDGSYVLSPDQGVDFNPSLSSQSFTLVARACTPDCTVCSEPEEIVWQVDARMLPAEHDFVLPVSPPVATPTPTQNPADLNGDGSVDGRDLLIFQHHWYQGGGQ